MNHLVCKNRERNKKKINSYLFMSYILPPTTSEQCILERIQMIRGIKRRKRSQGIAYKMLDIVKDDTVCCQPVFANTEMIQVIVPVDNGYTNIS